MLTTSTLIIRDGPLSPEEQDRRERDAIRRAADIETLKRARQQIAELRITLDAYSHDLSFELNSPARKMDEALAWLLLRRELESGS